MLEELTDLFRYTRWANGRLLDACTALSADELGRDMGSSFPSVLATLGHLASAEWIWLQRWLGSSPASPPEWDLSTLQAIRRHWDEVADARDRYLAALTESSLHEEVAYRNMKGESYSSPLWKLMRHVVNHSTHHRGQVVTMLRQLGASAPNTDLIGYFREH